MTLNLKLEEAVLGVLVQCSASFLTPLGKVFPYRPHMPYEGDTLKKYHCDIFNISPIRCILSGKKTLLPNICQKYYLSSYILVLSLFFDNNFLQRNKLLDVSVAGSRLLMLPCLSFLLVSSALSDLLLADKMTLQSRCFAPIPVGSSEAENSH